MLYLFVVKLPFERVTVAVLLAFLIVNEPIVAPAAGTVNVALLVPTNARLDPAVKRAGRQQL